MNANSPPQTGLAHRVRRELIEYASVSLYLFVCFGVIMLYKASVLQSYGVNYTAYGIAAAKALILGKFMLMGHAVRLGERHRHKRLIYTVLSKSSLFLVILVLLTIAEELIVGVVHGRPLADAAAGIAGGTWFQLAATCLLLWLILLPYFAFRQISETVGEGGLRRMLLDVR